MISLCGCLLIDKFTVEKKDINGEEDYSLAIFTDEDICEVRNKTYCIGYGYSPKGEKSFTDEDYWQDADRASAETWTTFSGTAVLQVTYGKTNLIEFAVECERTEGNLRIVLLNENYEIIHDFSIEEASSFIVENASGKTYQIRVTGESAKFTVDVAREFINE